MAGSVCAHSGACRLKYAVLGGAGERDLSLHAENAHRGGDDAAGVAECICEACRDGAARELTAGSLGVAGRTAAIEVGHSQAQPREVPLVAQVDERARRRRHGLGRSSLDLASLAQPGIGAAVERTLQDRRCDAALRARRQRRQRCRLLHVNRRNVQRRRQERAQGRRRVGLHIRRRGAASGPPESSHRGTRPAPLASCPPAAERPTAAHPATRARSAARGRGAEAQPAAQGVTCGGAFGQCQVRLGKGRAARWTDPKDLSAVASKGRRDGRPRTPVRDEDGDVEFEPFQQLAQVLVDSEGPAGDPAHLAANGLGVEAAVDAVHEPELIQVALECVQATRYPALGLGGRAGAQ